jgi:hypothetical protein
MGEWLTSEEFAATLLSSLVPEAILTPPAKD